MTLNERFKFIRNQLKLTQEQYAWNLNISPSLVSAIERGVRNVTNQHIDLICYKFKVNKNWFEFEQGSVFKTKKIDRLIALRKVCNILKIDDEKAIYICRYVKNHFE